MMTLRTVQYVPIREKMLPQFDTDTIARWLTDPVVRSTLLSSVTFTINDQEIESNRMEDRSYFDSPYFDEYTHYIRNTVLPSYLSHLKNTMPHSRPLIKRVLEYLLSASQENMTLPTESVSYIIGDIFPHLRTVQKPDEGNCYFCSIGHNLNLSSQEVRNILSTEINKSSDLEYLVKQYVSGCATGVFSQLYDRDPDRFVQGFPTLLKQECKLGDQDCNDCVWGGNEYDSYVASVFSLPVVAIQVEREGNEERISLSSYGSSRSVIEHYLGTSTYKMRTDQKYTINISYTFPPDVYQLFGDDMYTAFFEEYKTYIIYVLSRSHINAVSII